MMPLDFNAIAQQCAPAAHPTTLQAVVRTESGFNPYAIGVVGGHLARQPANRAEAVATARALEAQGWNFSVGLGQVNHNNLVHYGLNLESAFDPCANLRAGAAILSGCYTRASARMGSGQQALLGAFSCYYSGNLERGFRADFGHTSYVQRVVANVLVNTLPARTVNAAPTATTPVAAQSIAVVPAVLSVTTPRKVTRPLPTSASADDAPPIPARPHQAWDTFGDF